METIRKDSFYTELIQLGAEYLRAVALSYFLCGITQVYFALLKNTDHTAESSMAVVVNIMLNAVFIFSWLGAPAMGIRGAALATVIDRLTRLSALVGIATGLVLAALTPAVMNITELTPMAAEYLKSMILFTCLNLAAQSVNHVVLDGIFGMGGDAKFDMNTNIVFMWCICVPLSLMAAFWWHLPAPVVFCMYNMDEIIKLPVVFIHYRKYIWLRNITREMA